MSESLTDAGAFLEPYLPAQAYLHPAWLSCLSWAMTEPEILAAFRQDTGHAWAPGRTPLDRMVDEATGADKAFLEAFAAWMNVHVWGEV